MFGNRAAVMRKSQRVHPRQSGDRTSFSASAAAKERLRDSYRPRKVKILFVGESRPASGRFFYQADSGLYRAIRDTFLAAFPDLPSHDFLKSFRSLGCYLIDLCGRPVDRMKPKSRRRICSMGEPHLARTIRKLRPEIIVTVVRSIRANVQRAQERSGWTGFHLELPYPGRWQSHRLEFRDKLIPLLHAKLRKKRGIR